jgi:hypothetical protein
MRHFTASSTFAITLGLSGCGAIEVSTSSGQSKSLAQIISEAQGTSKQAEQSVSPAGHASGSTKSMAASAVLQGVGGTSNAQWPAKEGCRLLSSRTLKSDVDTVYARVMKRWKFTTNEQMQITLRNRADFMVESNYRHRATPGSTYDMAQSVRYDRDAGDMRWLWLDMTLTKDGAKATEVDVRYCALGDNKLDPKEHLQVQRLINDSLTVAGR